jgi:hypothetical protein
LLSDHKPNVDMMFEGIEPSDSEVIERAAFQDETGGHLIINPTTFHPEDLDRLFRANESLSLARDLYGVHVCFYICRHSGSNRLWERDKFSLLG